MHCESDDFYGKDLEAFLKIAEELPLEKSTHPDDLVTKWKKTVSAGKFYSGSLFDWDREVSIREALEKLLQHAQIKNLTTVYNNFKIEVDKADQEFLSISEEIPQRKGRTYWWERRILMYGIGLYEEHINQFYGIDPEAYLTRRE